MPSIIDVIEAPNMGPNDLVMRVPENGSGAFKFGSQVIVRESQRAVFYRDGKSLDLFEPGRVTISTMNLPLLSGLLSLFTGGNNVFTAEVYFVNLREMTDMKWGTPQPISLRDTDLGLVRLRAFGQYTIQIADPKRFVDQIVGTQGIYTTAQIEDYLRGAVLSRLTDVLGENMTSIFDLPKLFDEIGAGMKAKVQEDFLAMGINLKQFMIVSISPTDETAKAIDERSSMGAVGNLDNYMKYQTARAVGDAVWEGTFTIPTDHLVTGTNLLAVEVHQTDPTSSDVVFGMTLDMAIEPISTVPSVIVLNEVMANNVSVPDQSGSPSDWVELYNPTGASIDLTGYTLRDGGGNARRARRCR